MAQAGPLDGALQGPGEVAPFTAAQGPGHRQFAVRKAQVKAGLVIVAAGQKDPGEGGRRGPHGARSQPRFQGHPDFGGGDLDAEAGGGLIIGSG